MATGFLKLRPYQVIGADFLASRPAAICADAMGLGKTATAATAALSPIAGTQALRLLWVAPAATLPGLVKELPRWGLPFPHVINAKTIKDHKTFSVMLLSVDAAKMYREQLQFGPRFTHMILDEAHTCKNPSAKRTRAIYKIRTNADRFWALTGTPMPSRPIELQTMLYHGLRLPWAERQKYGYRYCFMPNRWTQIGYDFSGCTSAAIKEIPKLLTPYMIRRRPEDVPGELPPLRRAIVPLSAREPPLPFDKRTIIARFVERETVPFEDMAAYRSEMGMRKAPAVVAWVKTWLDDNPTESLVVFGWHRAALTRIAHDLQTPFLATGDSSPIARQKMVDTWDNRVFVASIGACGIGLNGLHRRAGACAFSENPWTPGEVQQAEGRIRRIGGMADSLMSYFLTADDSLESHILSLILEKMDKQIRIVDNSIGDLI
jgi:SWI/SNF-related matrix-associated actin-dependent regulator of chromatin subfamily A-like protein 1